MKVTLPTSEQFDLRQCFIANDACVLVTPNHIGCKWNSENLVFRSSIWTKDGYPVSLGFPKFFNYHEHPEIVPPPTNLKGCQLIEKVDGSCLILSLYKEQTIIRTRGTVDATILNNGYEIDILKKKYPRAFNLKEHLTVRDGTADHSLIFEWVSPVNKIVLNYGVEPDLYLTAAINHNDYSLLSQDSLDKMAAILHVKRPKKYNFSTIEEMLNGIEALEGQEGICLYYNGGQSIRKIKSAWYLALHSLKSNLTMEKLADLWLLWGKPSLPEFDAKFEAQFDYECLSFARGAIEELYNGIGILNCRLAGLRSTFLDYANLSRKDYAIKMQKLYQNKEFTIAMNIYLDKPISNDIIKYILLENTKPVKMGMFSN